MTAFAIPHPLFNSANHPALNPALVSHQFQQSQKLTKYHPILAKPTSLRRTSMCIQPTPPSLDDLISKVTTRPIQPTSKNLPPVVHLVGTGPGDPSLLTLQALRLMQQADIVLYDRLISDDILSLINQNAQMVYVGKRAGYHTRTQKEISQLLAMFATKNYSRNRIIVRLKGGDPYVYGRGGEEVEYLESLGIDVRVTPGITAAAGIGAELGIPMTSRGVASSVRFVTGHLREAVEECDLGHVDMDTTLVVYMGLGRLNEIVMELQRKGLSENLPAVAVERGCTKMQRVVWARLHQLARKVKEMELVSPTLVIIGRVVAMARGWRAQFREETNVKEMAFAKLDVPVSGLEM